MYTSAVKKSAINKATKNGLGEVVFRHEGKYCVELEENMPEGAKMVWKDGEAVSKPKTTSKIVKNAEAKQEEGSEDVEAENSAKAEISEEDTTPQSDIEEDRMETGVHVSKKEESAEEGETTESSTEVEVEEEHAETIEIEVKQEDLDMNPELAEEGIEVGVTVEVEPMTEVEIEESEVVKAAHEKGEQIEAGTSPEGAKELPQTDPTTQSVEDLRKKVIVRQTEPRGAVTVGTVDVRKRPEAEMVKEIEALESCSKIIPTGGAVHAYPASDEVWDELMNEVIKLVNKYYSDNDFNVVIDRIK